MERLYRVSNVRLIFWIIALTVGAAQTWTSRHEILSDGISYMEIASAYLAGDWGAAVNAYWSPLFSWVIAFFFAVLHPSSYWQVATVHLSLFLTYIGSLIAFEFFLKELWAQMQPADELSEPIPQETLYVAGYATVLFVGIALVGFSYCSPDMLALLFFIVLTTIVLRIRRTGGSLWQFSAFGIVSGLFYLARTAFLPLFIVFLATIVVLLIKQHRSRLVASTVAVLVPFALLTLPFITAISVKTGKFTIGESGRLNYGWEVAGASRLIHWQGEPYDIGTPLHPTKLAVKSPKTFLFTTQSYGSYSPWFDPSYWYAGINPKVKLPNQLHILFVQATVAINYLFRSPLLLPCCLLGLILAPRLWSRELIRLWPVFLPGVIGIAIYCMVYFEKRYVSGNMLMIWIVVLSALRFTSPRRKQIASGVVLCCSLLFTGVYVLHKQVWAVRTSVSDLVHHREKERNTHFYLAKALQRLGLRAGDKVAYIGPAINAEWARIAQVRIVGEVPLLYGRTERLFNNLLEDDTSQIRLFCSGDEGAKKRVLDAFRSTGARMVVADGFFEQGDCHRWPLVLSSQDREFLPGFNPNGFSEVNSRYYVLTAADNLAELSQQ